MLECSYCAKGFKYESEKKRHELSHIPQFECKECCKKFSFLSALKRHQKQHERTCSVVCSDCGRSFRDDTLLRRHIKYAHKGIKVCSKCGSKFNSDLALSSHMKSHKPKSERKFKCKYFGCTKSFNFTHHLKHHEMTHTNQKQHSCKICGKGFIQLHHFKSHLKSHMSDNALDSPEGLIFPHRTTIDSGISSDSNCDNSQDSIKGSKLCLICSQRIQKTLFEIHKEKCKIKEEKPEDLLSITEFINNKRVKSDVNYCDAVTGGCIANGDSSGNDCLCAQIKIDVDFPDIASPIEPIITKNEVMPIESLGDNVVNSMCGGCNYSSKKICNLSTIKREYHENDVPQIEYRNDGVIKIKDTFDIDITEINTHIEKDFKVEKDRDVLEINYVPYNSCQAVLGRCIASGNGTMSEDCLCAKMAMDDQTIISQEIDEITPQPNVSPA